jgi:hypothetical protein
MNCIHHLASRNEPDAKNRYLEMVQKMPAVA